MKNKIGYPVEEDMTNQQILEKAIQRAIDGGWDVDLRTVLSEMEKKWSVYGLQYTGYSGLLFSHDFAKALWGEEAYKLDNVLEVPISNYEHHLMQMVIAEDPIKYLGENL